MSSTRGISVACSTQPSNKRTSPGLRCLAGRLRRLVAAWGEKLAADGTGDGVTYVIGGRASGVAPPAVGDAWYAEAMDYDGDDSQGTFAVGPECRKDFEHAERQDPT